MTRLGELPDGVRDMVFRQLPSDRLAAAARASNSGVWRVRTSPVEACMQRLAKLLEYLQFESNTFIGYRDPSVVLIGDCDPVETAEDVDEPPDGTAQHVYAVKARRPLDGTYSVQSLGDGYPTQRPMTAAAVLDWSAAGPALRQPALHLVFAPGNRQAWSLTFPGPAYAPGNDGAAQLQQMLA